MNAVLQSATASLPLLLLLLLQLTSPAHGQYMSGYGTGPYIPELMFPFGQGNLDSNDPKYDGAKSASQFAAIYYSNENNVGRKDSFPDHESPYKYHAPLFPSVSTGTLPPLLSHQGLSDFGGGNSISGFGGGNLLPGFGAGNSGYGYGAGNSGFGFGAGNTGFGFGAGNAGFGFGAVNSDYGYGAGNAGYGGPSPFY